MKYVPSLPPPTVSGVDRYELRPLPGVQPSRPVQQRNLPPLVFQPRNRNVVRARVEQAERRHDPHLHGERRSYCRRTMHQPVLVELRSGHDRRQHKQRATDMTEHINEEI